MHAITGRLVASIVDDEKYSSGESEDDGETYESSYVSLGAKYKWSCELVRGMDGRGGSHGMA